MSCDNLCTAAKCQELEERIGRLEQIVDLLEASFEAHVSQAIPIAHDYQPEESEEPEVTVSLAVAANTLKVFVKVGSKSGDETIELPKNEPEVEVSLAVGGNDLKVFVKVGEKSDDETIALPKYEPVKSNLVGTAFVEGQKLFISIADGESETVFSTNLPIPEIELPNFEPIVNVSTNYISSDTIATTVSVNGVSDQDTFSLPIPELPETPKSNLVGTAFVEGQRLFISIADGESQTVFSTDLPIPELPEIPESNLVGTAFVEGQKLFISIADGESQTVFSTDLPIAKIEPPFVTVDVFPLDDHNFTIKVGVDGVFDSDTLTTTMIDCSDLEVLINDLSLTITNKFNNLDIGINNLENTIETNINDLSLTIANETNNLDIGINNLENTIETNINEVNELSLTITNEFNNLDIQFNNLDIEINEVKDVVTVDISGMANSSYKCEFELDSDQNPIPKYAQSLKESKAYSGVGLQGIHENLKVINSNLDALHSDICKAVDPITTIRLSDLYKFCDNSNIERSDYPEGVAGDAQYDDAVLQYFTDLFAETKYAYLLDNVVGDKLVTAPNNWITNYLTDFSLIQSKINNTELCNLEIPEATDVVSLVASPKYQTNIEGKVLILHFVTFDNYPKRMNGSTYWAIQIPGAKESYVWENDFKDLTWQRGNEYAELQLKDYRARVSGWFVNKEAANAYFDAVLSLTSAVEENRIYPEHKTPKTNVIARVVRPYRAFIESVNEAGQAICHIKYVPPIEPNG